MSAIKDGVLESIGHTPIIKLKHFDTGPCELYVKLESANPGGSIKDRPALYMIEEAERQGLIKPGGTLIEATAGNTGLGLALVANQKGYKLLLVLPDKMSQEKIFHLKAAGAEIVMTRSDVQKGHPEYYQDLAAAMAAKMDNAFYVNQFANEANVRAHYEMTGPEIYQQMNGQLDAFVCGVGTGGTLTGAGGYLKEQNANIDLVLADPKGSVLKHYIETGEMIEAQSWMVEGIGEDFIPSICNIGLVDHAYTISDQETFLHARELLAKEGILAGSSTGTLLGAALEYCQAQTEPKKVLTLVCDSGNKYFSKMFNDYWMVDHGFLEKETYHDLRDLISRPHWLRDTIFVRENDSINIAFNRMRLYDISQMPVLSEDEEMIGLLDESDLLFAVQKHQNDFTKPVKTAMTTRLEMINYKSGIDDLKTLFSKDYVAIVVDDDQKFLGIITRIDLLNYLRRQLNHW